MAFQAKLCDPDLNIPLAAAFRISLRRQICADGDFQGWVLRIALLFVENGESPFEEKPLDGEVRRWLSVLPGGLGRELGFIANFQNPAATAGAIIGYPGVDGLGMGAARKEQRGGENDDMGEN